LRLKNPDELPLYVILGAAAVREAIKVTSPMLV